METRKQIEKDYNHRIRNGLLVLGSALILTTGGVFYHTRLSRQVEEELAKKRDALVRQYLNTKDIVLPYLRSELGKFDKFDYSLLDSSLVSENLTQKLGKIHEINFNKKRNLEEALQIAQKDSSYLAQTIEVNDYNSQLKDNVKAGINRAYGFLATLLSLGGLSMYLVFRAYYKRRKALNSF